MYLPRRWNYSGFRGAAKLIALYPGVPLLTPPTSSLLDETLSCGSFHMTLAVGGTLTTNSVTHIGFTVFSDADLICGRMTTDGHYILALDSYVNIYTNISIFPIC